MRARVALAVLAGVVCALSLPPWGWWPLGFAGVAGLALALAGLPAVRRAMVGNGFGLGLFSVGLWWMGEFNAGGAALAVILEACFVGVAALAVPPAAGDRRLVALPAALVLAEAARRTWPFGGVPVAGIALGQAGGPLAGAARVGGELAVVALVAAGGVGLAALARRRWAAAGVAVAVVVAGGAAGALAPDGRGAGSIDVAAVQGGGPRGFRGVDTDPADVLDAHLAASRRLAPAGAGGVDLVVWPEDVVDVAGPIARSPEAAAVSEVAVRAGAALVAGVVEDTGKDRFRNAAVVFTAAGTVADRYDKVVRVPFGEYVPARSLFERVADLSAVPRDAIAGDGPGVVGTSAGRAGVLISYEVFFARRARAATGAGGRVLLVPTNAASYRTTQVPAQQVAAARLRAIESGRHLVQAAPTGYSAVVDHRGRVKRRSTLGRREVLTASVGLRTGTTLYHRAGDVPLLIAAAATLAAAWAARRRFTGE